MSPQYPINPSQKYSAGSLYVEYTSRLVSKTASSYSFQSKTRAKSYRLEKACTTSDIHASTPEFMWDSILK
jgi:hypothetical protein